MKLYPMVADRLPQYEQLVAGIEQQKTPVLAVGLSDIHKAHLLYALSEQLLSPLLIICDEETAARRMCDDVNAMHGKETPAALLYPAREYNFRGTASASREYEQQRIGVLSKLLRQECKLCFASAEALCQHTIPPAQLQKRTFSIEENQSYSLEELTAKLLQAGYARRPQVDGIAQFAIHGGILDVYPPDAPAPVRIEFWGDDIDSISRFELDSQRRTDAIDGVLITPACECLFDSPEDLAARIREFVKRLKDKTAKEHLAHDLERLDAELELSSLDKYLPLAYEHPATLLDYFDPENTVLAVSEFSSAIERMRSASWQYAEDLKALFEEGELCKGLDSYQEEFSAMQAKWDAYPVVYLDTFARTSGGVHAKTLVTFHPLQTSTFSGDLKLLREDLAPLLENGDCVVVLAGNEKSAANLAHDLSKTGIPAESVRDLKQLTLRHVYVMPGTLSAGFEYPEAHFALIATSRAASAPVRRPRHKQGKAIRSLDDLMMGDPVVHVSHGIGIFDGIHKIDVQGVVKDYIKIRYAGQDTLFVPVTQLDLVSKYVGPKDESRIKLNKLNSGEWQKTKTRVRKACADMADDLIKLYAARMQEKGYAFSPDTIWQTEFEDRFEYTETDDQLQSIAEIKQDMERPVPMDRLLCGDVGFGKTEVALRAAFKCVNDSKQCALLCPTTILAWQHYQNALQRFEGYPIRIELLSRFRSQKQIRETLKKLKNGEVDFVIGTHRLVQKDVEFKDLGLAIIDEEQRFGVAHKEKFKEMFHHVDVLTLSATPIPRTLNMAMSGIRDLSSLEQPPQDRHPIQTYVLEYDDNVIADAIRKELRRNGQVYYIHNRIETIDRCAARIQAMAPDAVVAVAHGRMSETEISDIWRKVMQKEIDILVCTTLIETGIDVKNVNTLIIENADYLGLAQLYQLRGRVGRSNRRAYAYLTFQRGKVLTEISTKRLNAIREFTTFGSGIRIAMRDLEIRGAGSILGGSQHGHMEAVGYDLYVQLLSEAIAERKGEKKPQATHECLIDVQIDAHIPEDYIENLTQRLDIYKKIASIQTEEDRMDLIDELLDRFGDVPQTVQTLLSVSLLRNTLASHGFMEITQKGRSILLFPETLDPELAADLMRALRGRVLLNASAKPYLTIRMEGGVVSTLQEVSAFLQKREREKAQNSGKN
jgi:transcription-repair coupling factor (superfamily II helicase)